MTPYEYALALVLESEGGLSDHPLDPGSRTMKGITQARFDEYRQGNLQPLGDVALITDDELAAIYRTYWDAVAGDNLEPKLAIVAMDIAVNSGPGRANAWLQEGYLTPSALTARRLQHYADLSTFGAFGRGWTRRAARVLLAAERYADV